MSVSNPALVGLRVKDRPFSAVMEDVNRMIRLSGLLPDTDTFDPPGGHHSRIWPTTNPEAICRWVACFPVRGGSEAFYVHIHPMIQVLNADHIDAPLAGLAKVWSWEEATKLAAIAAEIFDWTNLAD